MQGERRTMAQMQRGFRQDIIPEFRRVSDTIGGIIQRNAAADGRIPARAENTLARLARDAVQRLFIAADGSGPFAENGETALAPYPRLLNKWYVLSVAAAVRAHQRWLKQNTPDEVYEYLANAPTRPAVILDEQTNPFLRRDGESVDDHIERLSALRIFAPDQNMDVDAARRWVPLHRWTDSRGYQLSDRIWNLNDLTRRQVDNLIRDGIRAGIGAVQLARLVERFLKPGAAALRTNKPYGSDGSYAALRLARTEISRALNLAAFHSARNNPYVAGIDVARSPNGDPTCPICPQHATLDISGSRVREPYRFDTALIPPYHPHDMCRVQSVVTAAPEAVTQQLRGVLQDGQVDLYLSVTTPAQAEKLIEEMLGEVMARLLRQLEQPALL